MWHPGIRSSATEQRRTIRLPELVANVAGRQSALGNRGGDSGSHFPASSARSRARVADFALWAATCETALCSSAAPIRQTATPTQLLPACGRSWSSATRGWASRPSAGWRRSQPGCVARRRSFACWALKYLSPTKGRAGTRTIRISAGVENRATIVSAVSSVSVLCHDISIGCGKPPKNWGVLQARERC